MSESFSIASVTWNLIARSRSSVQVHPFRTGHEQRDVGAVPNHAEMVTAGPCFSFGRGHRLDNLSISHNCLQAVKPPRLHVKPSLPG